MLSTAFLGVIIIFACFLAFYLGSRKPSGEHEPPVIPLYKALYYGLSHLENLFFIAKRDYGDVWCFQIPFWKRIYFVFGEENARTYHSSRNCDFEGGFALVTEKLFPQYHFMIPPNKRLVPILQKELGKSRLDKVLQVTKRDVAKWMSKLEDKGSFNFFDEIYHYVLTLGIRIFAGHEIADGQDLEQFIQLFKDTDPEENAKDFLVMLTSVFPGFTKRRNAMFAKFKAILDNVVDNRVRKGLQDDDLLDFFIRSATDEDGNVDNIHIFDNVWSALFASTLTTFATLAWTIVEGISHPELLKLAIEEGKEKIIERGECFDAYNNMKLFDNFIRETIRCHVSGFSLRQATEDIQFKKNKTDVAIVPEGSLIGFFHNDSNRNPEVFSDPDSFNPNRFFDEGKRPCTYVGFGAGRHPCLGTKMASQSIKVFVTEFYSNFDLQLNSSIEIGKRQVFGLGKPIDPVIIHYQRK